jgi:sugar lactone lactonase YvrE
MLHTTTRLLSILPTLLVATMLGCDGDTADASADAELRSGAAPIEVVATFNQAAFETPESLVIDDDGNIIVSMALTGELRKVAPNGTQSALAWIPLGQCAPNPFPPIMGALATDFLGNIYVGAATCDPANRGIWKVTPSGTTSLVASLPPDALPNGIVVLGNFIYVADSGAPRIWRARITDTGAPATVWTTSPLLADPNPADFAPGANGLQSFLGSLYVANAGAATIVEIPFEQTNQGPFNFAAGQASVKYGPAGSGAEVETDPGFVGCDDFAFDVLGRIYCTTDPFQSVVRINLDGSLDTIMDASTVDGPTAAIFGKKKDRRTLYVSNAAFPFFPPTGNGPSILKTTVNLPGYPLR